MPSVLQSAKQADSCGFNLDWILDKASVERLLGELGFRDDIVAFVGEIAREVSRSLEAQPFLEFCTAWQDNPERQPAGLFPPAWEVLIAVAAFPQAIEKHRLRGVPFAITRATLLDLQRRMDEYSAREGRVGFDRLSWMRHHVSGQFFEIGRLQYALGTFGYLCRVYRDKEINKVISLAHRGRKCTAEGLPNDDATGFITRWEQRQDGIHAHAVLPDAGVISPGMSRVRAGSAVLLDENSIVGQIHIPAGERLELEACCNSLQAAKAFFSKHFPEAGLRGFCTATWLLDPELRKVLPVDSNIVCFGKLFHLLPLHNADDTQLRERVFGKGTAWENCLATTSLQKAVLEHHRAGGKFRTTAGFVLSEELV